MNSRSQRPLLFLPSHRRNFDNPTILRWTVCEGNRRVIVAVYYVPLRKGAKSLEYFLTEATIIPRHRCAFTWEKEHIEDGRRPCVILLQPRNWQLRVIFSFHRRWHTANLINERTRRRPRYSKINVPIRFHSSDYDMFTPLPIGW